MAQLVKILFARNQKMRILIWILGVVLALAFAIALAIFIYDFLARRWYAANSVPDKYNQRFTGEMVIYNYSSQKVLYAVTGFERGGFGAGFVMPKDGTHSSTRSYHKHPATITIEWRFCELQERGDHGQLGEAHVVVLPFAGVAPPGVDGTVFLEFDDQQQWSLRFVPRN